MKIFLILMFLASFVGCASGNRPDKETSKLSISKEKADLYFSIAQSYEENGFFEKAIENAQEALKIDSEHAQVHFFLGKLLIKKGFLEEGLVSVKKALKHNTKYTKARNFLADYYIAKLKRHKAAKILVDQSAKDLIYENQEETWALKLKLDLFLGGKALASKSVLKAAAIPPAHCKHRLSIARSLYKMNLLDPALNSARAASKLCPVRHAARIDFLKGLVFVKKQNLLVAEKIFREIETDNVKLKKQLVKAQNFVRRKINSRM